MSTRNLDAVFAPRAVAIIGATDRPHSIGGQVTLNLMESFRGRLFGVNPRRPHLAGVEVVASIADLPIVPDFAIIVTPPDSVVETAEALAEKGTRAALVITDAKRGQARASAVRRALRAIADRTGMRIIGPNALGIVSPTVRATMSSLKAPLGNIAFIGQATMAAGTVAERVAQEHLGFSGLAACGDMVDVDFADLIDWFAADTPTRVIVLVMENVGVSRSFLSAARLAARSKPLIVLRAPTDPLPPHREAVFAAAMRRAGALSVRTLEDLFAAIEAVAVRLPSDTAPTMGRRLAILSNGESMGALGRIAAEAGNIELAQFSEPTIDRLSALLPPARKRVNPVDILPDATADRFAKAMEILFEDKGVDAVLSVFGPAGASNAPDVAAAIADIVGAARKRSGRRRPFVMTAFCGGDAEAVARDEMGRLHIPAYDSPSTAVRAFAALVALRRAAQRVTATPEFVAGLEAQHVVEVEHRARAAVERTGGLIDATVAGAIRRALWLGKSDGPSALTWRIAVEMDPEFGPAIFFGPGGAFSRIAGEPTAALPPLNAATAQELIAASRYARAAQAEGLLTDDAAYAFAALLVRVSDLIASAPSIQTLVIDGLVAEDGRPSAPPEAISGTVALIEGDPDQRFAIRPYPRRLATVVTGDDGAPYRIRPMRAEDEPALRDLGAHMSPEHLRLRFFQPMRSLSHDMAVRLTQIDYDREMAFALLPTDAEILLAVVRLHRDTRGDTGEYAITVRSDQQGKGFGRLMMERIIDYARSQGLKSVFGTVLAENRSMLKLSHALGFKSSIDPEDASVVRVELTL